MTSTDATTAAPTDLARDCDVWLEQRAETERALLKRVEQWVLDTAAQVAGAPVTRVLFEAWASDHETCFRLKSGTDVHGNDIEGDDIAARLLGLDFKIDPEIGELDDSDEQELHDEWNEAAWNDGALFLLREVATRWSNSRGLYVVE